MKTCSKCGVQSEKRVFIYALCEPGTRTIRYIGKAGCPKTRFKSHLTTSIKKKTHLGNWLRSLLGVAPNLVLLSEVPEAEGFREEIRYIAAARTSLGMNLVNSTDGGEGGLNPSPETRAKLSAAHKGVLKGPLPPETRAKMSAAKIGVRLSPERCAAQSARQKGVPKSPEWCAAVSAAHKGKSLSLEHRAAISAVQKGVPKSPEHRLAIGAAKKGVPRTLETRARLSALRKGVPWTAARRAAQNNRRPKV